MLRGRGFLGSTWEGSLSIFLRPCTIEKIFFKKNPEKVVAKLISRKILKNESLETFVLARSEFNFQVSKELFANYFLPANIPLCAKKSCVRNKTVHSSLARSLDSFFMRSFAYKMPENVTCSFLFFASFCNNLHLIICVYTLHKTLKEEEERERALWHTLNFFDLAC